MFPLIRAICEAGKVAPRAALARQQSSVLSLVALCVSSVFLCFVKQSAHAHTKGKPRQGETLRPVLGQRFQHRCVPSLHKAPEGQMDKLSSFLPFLSLTKREEMGERREFAPSVFVPSAFRSHRLFTFLASSFSAIPLLGCRYQAATRTHTHRSCMCKCIYLVQRAHAREKKYSAISLISQSILQMLCAHISRSLLASEEENTKNPFIKTCRPTTVVDGSHNVSRWMTWLPISLKNAAKCDKWYQLQNHSITESLNANGARKKPLSGSTPSMP